MAIPREDLKRFYWAWERFEGVSMATLAIEGALTLKSPILISISNGFQFTNSWLAGFIDNDGSINAQIVSRSDYKLRYQVRVTLTLFQSTERHHILLYIQKLLKSGVVRKRKRWYVRILYHWGKTT